MVDRESRDPARRARPIMVQGVASSVGKSVICASLCRVFAQDGYTVYPFKSQNMASNSYVTRDGGEMGRAQAIQAEACGMEPHVNMNPILLKPGGDGGSQVVVLGRVWGNLSAKRYEGLKPRLEQVVRDAYGEVCSAADIVVIEGAGSPAEINLEDRFVNMGMARIAGAPVILVGDIDRGGVFASLAGTMMLLDEGDRARVKGAIINKFRGDLEALKPGLEKLERMIGVPVLGVLPHMDVGLDDEDGATEAFCRRAVRRDLRIAVVWLPHISNFTDFTPLQREPDVSLEYVRSAPFGKPDLLIIPGTENAISDLLYLKERGVDGEMRRHHAGGGQVMGICGGFQMLGLEVRDPHGVKGSTPVAAGLGLLPITTWMGEEKRTARVRARVLANDDSQIACACSGLEISGYETHMGRTTYPRGDRHFFSIVQEAGASATGDGWVGDDGRVIGVHLHGIFENAAFTRALLDSLRRAKGMEPLGVASEEYAVFKSRQYDLLADCFRKHIDVPQVYRILSGRTP